MTYTSITTWLEDELQGIRDAGMYKAEKVIKSPQGSMVETPDGPMINFCANNYLGLADNAEIEEAVSQGTKD